MRIDIYIQVHLYVSIAAFPVLAVVSRGVLWMPFLCILVYVSYIACIHTYTYVHMYVYIYMYINTCTYMYVLTYMYM